MSKELLQIPLTINASMVRREIVDGAECIIIKSATLPDNIVMNGGLYLDQEIEKSFATLERVLAPVGHPEKDGKFISANDPYAIHNFDVGAYVANVERKNGKVHHDTIINIDVANQTERGRELLEAIENMEKNGVPIHTSTGVLLEREILDKPQMNAAEVEYTWIARNMKFDHNAILPNQIGAATPEQGVGLMVNAADVDMASFEGNEEALIDNTEESINSIVFEMQEKLKSFVKRMGFAKGIQETYNGVTNSINEEPEMTPEEMQALLDAQSAKMEANLDKKLAPLTEKIASLEANAKSAEKAERAPLEEIAANAGYEAEEIALMTNSMLKKLADKVNGSATYAAGGEPVVNADKQEFSRELP